jgi:hypothetical protein
MDECPPIFAILILVAGERQREYARSAVYGIGTSERWQLKLRYGLLPKQVSRLSLNSVLAPMIH